jgi:hypothetical protein
MQKATEPIQPTAWRKKIAIDDGGHIRGNWSTCALWCRCCWSCSGLSTRSWPRLTPPAAGAECGKHLAAKLPRQELYKEECGASAETRHRSATNGATSTLYIKRSTLHLSSSAVHQREATKGAAGIIGINRSLCSSSSSITDKAPSAASCREEVLGR